MRAEVGGGRTIPEASPAYSSASNGLVDRGVQSVEAQIRVMRSALEEKWKAAISENHEIWASLVEYSGYLLNRCEVGHDGKTSYERSKRKVATVLGLEFGELIHWSNTSSPGKLSPKWDLGIFLGILPLTGEVWVGDAEGLWTTRTVHRQPLALRWNVEEARQMMQGIPREREKEDGPYRDPTEHEGGEDEDFFGAWDKVEPAAASSRRKRGQDEAP